jgi:hypothetical protein
MISAAPKIGFTFSPKRSAIRGLGTGELTAMKKNLLKVIPQIIVAALCCLPVNGCKKETPATPLKSSSVVSAEKTSFNEVAAQLDAGGNLYLYLGTEQLLESLSGKVSGWRQLIASLPDAEGNAEQIGKVFDVVTNLIRDSGIEDISGFGVSAIATEPEFYRAKALLHHYPGKGNGFLWKLGGEKPHELTGLDLLPGNTAFATFSDVNIPMLWSVIEKQVKQSGFPEARGALQQLPDQFEKATGLKWETTLASLGGEFGLAITLDETKMIPIPLPTSEPLQVPEPGLMLVMKVKDEVIFNRIDAALKQTGQQVVRIDKPDLKMRTVPVPLPLPIQLRPTVAVSEGYLFIASNDGLIQEVLAVKGGKKPGLKSTDEFKHLARDIPAQGNQFTFLSQRFGQTIFEIQKQALAMATAKSQGPEQQLIQTLLQSHRPMFSYSVSANTAEGWWSVGNGNQHPAKMFLASAMVPVGMLSAIAIPNFVKARQASQKNACINNLRQIDGAKQQWALENNKESSDVPMQKDIQPFIGRGSSGIWPVCPQGGNYTIGSVDQPPTCSISGHEMP